MTEAIHIYKKLMKRLKKGKTLYNRFNRHFISTFRIGSKVLSLLTFIASLICLIAMFVYIGFEHSNSETQLIQKILHASQIVFIVNIIFNLIFNFRTTVNDTRIIKWISDILVLVSVIPLVYPDPLHPWIPILEQILYSNRFLFPVLGLYSILSVSFGIIKMMGKRTNPSLILSCSFIGLIVMGSFLLMMPRCTVQGINYIDSLFVSTSAVCITGLTTVDVATTFTPFGLLILGVLAQVGGLGVMTFTSFFALFFSGNTTIYSQLMVKDMIYTKSINSLLPSLLYILGFTLVVEGIGAVAFFFSIHDTMGMTINEELIFSAFHAMSAFCNAGFSNVEGGLSNPSFLHGNQWVYIVASVLIFLGGIGFPILVNFKEAFSRYLRKLYACLTRRKDYHEPVHIFDMNTKVVLITTLTITLVSSILFLIFENDNSLKGMTVYEKCVQSVFNSFVPRSSGFSSVNPVGFMNITFLMMLFLMWIGGASQSTAGGIKVNTFAVMLLNLRTIISGRVKVTVFDRTVAPGSVRRANAVIAISIISLSIYTVILVALEPNLPVKALIFESTSALFTVGSSLGITPLLSTSSKILLCTSMFLGRVGILSILIGFFAGTGGKAANFPTDTVIIN